MKPPLSLILPLFFGLFWLQTTAQVGGPPAGQMNGMVSGPIILRDGWVVRNGDTLRGRIVDSGWLVTPQRIVFVGGTTEGASSFGPRDVSGFGVGGMVFRTWTVRVYPYSLDPAVVADPGWSNAPFDTTVFMECVTRGRLDLYSYRDGADVSYFFIAASGGRPEQLRIVNRAVKKGAAIDVLTDDLYKYQLADDVKGCPMIAKRPVDVDYEENALNRLITTYNHCGKELVVTHKGNYRWLFHVVPMVGGLYSSVWVTGNSDASHVGWPAFYGPAGGLGLLVQPSKGQRRWAIQADVLYDHFSLKGSQYHKNYYQRFDARLDYDEIKGNLQVRYQYPMRHVSPFIGIGVSNTVTINNQSTQTLTDVGNSQTIRQPLFGSTDYFRMYRPGAFVSLGAAVRKWAVEGRVEQTQQMVSLPGVTAPVMNFYLLIGYMF